MNYSKKTELTKEQAEIIKTYVDIAVLNQNSESTLVGIVIKNCFKMLGDIAYLKIIKNMNEEKES